MKKAILAAATLFGLLVSFPVQSFAASLVAYVDIASQTMTVSKFGQVLYVWKVSTAGRGYSTPRGSWQPKGLYRMWRSRKYDNSPMPYSVFYNGGYAVHGTYAVKHLGRPASHGCVRLHPTNAATFYSLVQETGRNDTRIVIE